MTINHATDTTAVLADRLFDLIEEGDIQEVSTCFDPSAEFRYNTDDVVRTLPMIVEVLTGLVDRIADRRYVDRRLILHRDGFVQQHVLTGTRVGDGAVVRLPACVVTTVRNGMIVRFDEYLDSAHVAEFHRFATR